MNIFAIDSNPVKAAISLVDCHVVKMLLESCQLLCTTYHEQNIVAPYKPTHKNHPSSIWTRTSYDNLQWLIKHAYGISDEYTLRYGKIHKSLNVLKWCDENSNLLKFPSEGLTSFAIAINENALCRKDPTFDESDPVKCYQLYYKYDKKDIAKWTKRDIPEFML
jgi:hypothetical protein